MRSISLDLQNKSIIRSRIIFEALVIMYGGEKHLISGDYMFEEKATVFEVAKRVSKGDRRLVAIKITIPEGFDTMQIAELFDSKLVNFDKEVFLKAVQDREGYLFPDTYLIPKDATADTVISILKNNFNNKLTDEIKQRFAQLDLTEKEGIIVASLVEKEGRTDTDRPIIAGIILNRLEIGMKLDIDATIQYALGYQPNEKTWWKKNLTENDKLINSFYNTYRNAGLPPTPICNPGLSSITAVSKAKINTSYLYYMHDNKGRAYFAETLEEHIFNINRHLR